VTFFRFRDQPVKPQFEVIMSTNRTIWSLLVIISLSAYLFLQYQQNSYTTEEETSVPQLLEEQTQLDNPTIQPDVRLLKHALESVVRLLPAS
jgi:hypothetical protein